MANINKIRLSGQTYNIEDVNATKTVELTQAQYDALVTAGTIDVNTFYIITDAEYFDPSDVMTSAQTESAITAAVSGKADTSAVTSVNNALTAHTGDSTIHVTTAQTAAWNAKSDFSGSYNDLTDKPTIPTSASQLTNDVGYLVTNDITGKTDTSAFTAHTSDSDIHVTSSEKSTWNAKSDFSGSYNDLTDKPTLFSGDYNDLTNKPTIPTVPTSNTAFTNDAGYITSSALDGYATEQWVGQQGYLTQHQDISGKQDVSGMTAYTEVSAFTAHTANTDIHVTTAQTAAWDAKSDFSGSYNDLTDKPTIPTVPTSNTAFTNDAGYITSDAISGKADTSAVTESINAAVSGKVDKSTFNTYSGSVETALSGKADTATTYTKTEVDNAITAATSTKQDTLVSGTNIKTINNESILGEGNITIEGGGGKAVSGGTNISITTGETADTINCTIPAFFHSNTVKGDIEIGSNDGVNSDYGRLVIGRRVQSRGNPFFQYSIGIGVQPDNSNKYCQLYGQNSVGIGRGFKIGSDSLYANGINNAIAIGHNATSRNDGDITLGADTTASGGSSVAIGSGATANGSDYKMNLNNQIKVTPSNQVYISNSANTSTYCLQEKIENTEAALGGLSLVKLTQSEYDALATKDNSTLYVIVN